MIGNYYVFKSLGDRFFKTDVEFLIDKLTSSISSITSSPFNSFRSKPEATEIKSTTELRKVFFVLLVSVGYFFALPWLHFIVASIIYLVLLFIFLGEKRWWLVASMSVITTMFVYFLFGNLLNVLLP